MPTDMTPEDAGRLPAAVAAGGVVRLAEGVYPVTSPVRLPAWPNRARVEGFGATVTGAPGFTGEALVAGPLSGCATAGAVEGLSLLPSAGGPAIAATLAQMRHCAFRDIVLAPAPGPAGFVIGFALDASKGACYGNLIDRLTVQEGVGPSYPVWSNAFVGPARYANANTIRGFWCYAKAGVAVALCLNATTLSVVDGGVIESCPGATGVLLGQATAVRGVWFESLAKPIDAVPNAAMSPSGCLIENCYFSGPSSSPWPVAAPGLVIQNSAGVVPREMKP